MRVAVVFIVMGDDGLEAAASSKGFGFSTLASAWLPSLLAAALSGRAPLATIRQEPTASGCSIANYDGRVRMLLQNFRGIDKLGSFQSNGSEK